jgi:hypothetical protein
MGRAAACEEPRNSVFDNLQPICRRRGVDIVNFDTLIKVFDTVVAVRDSTKRNKAGTPSDMDLKAEASPGLAGSIEARLTNVILAALKEAFDRDHTRLELERGQVEEQRRRADEAVRLELRRQAADREIGRLRLLAASALIGLIASIMLFLVKPVDASIPTRMLLASGWLLFLGSMASAFIAQGRLGAYLAEADRLPDTKSAGSMALWLLMVGFALSAVSLLF